jgi:RNA polymerase sigma factor (TIGR02999 family)
MNEGESRQEAVTAMLQGAAADGVDPVEQLWPLIYDDLRAMAHRQLERERPGHTLVTTALVNEAYLKLVDSPRVAIQGRAYFFGAAARAMRQILVDHARSRKRLKRGGGSEDDHADPGPTLLVDEVAVEVLDLHEALEQLAEEHPRPARVVEYRFFGGLNVEEAASALGVSPRTVKVDWALARAWLYRALRRTPHADGEGDQGTQ